jgi:hypothetical protein
VIKSKARERTLLSFQVAAQFGATARHLRREQQDRNSGEEIVECLLGTLRIGALDNALKHFHVRDYRN